MNYADYMIVKYILNDPQGVSTEEVLEHLTHDVLAYPEQKTQDKGLKNVQNRLKKIADCEHFSHIIEVTSNGRKKLYKRVGTSIKGEEAAMSIEQACALLMSDKHLSALSPSRLFQSQGEYQELIGRAETAVRKHQYTRLQHKNHISDFLKRVAVVQRGQSLGGAKVNDEVLQCIAKCILNRLCINLTYNNKHRVLHPFGLVFRKPKVYLLAVDTKTLNSKGASKVRPAQFLCNRIQSPTVSKVPHRVPEDFDIDDYVKKGRLDILAYADIDSGSRSFMLKLRLHGKYKDNLIRDLQEYPLSEEQDIIREPGTDNYVLTAKGMRATYSLVEWIMGRMDRVEVLLPKSLRKHVTDKVDAMYQRYHP